MQNNLQDQIAEFGRDPDQFLGSGNTEFRAKKVFSLIQAIRKFQDFSENEKELA